MPPLPLKRHTLLGVGGGPHWLIGEATSRQLLHEIRGRGSVETLSRWSTCSQGCQSLVFVQSVSTAELGNWGWMRGFGFGFGEGRGGKEGGAPHDWWVPSLSSWGTLSLRWEALKMGAPKTQRRRVNSDCLYLGFGGLESDAWLYFVVGLTWKTSSLKGSRGGTERRTPSTDRPKPPKNFPMAGNTTTVHHVRRGI